MPFIEWADKHPPVCNVLLYDVIHYILIHEQINL